MRIKNVFRHLLTLILTLSLSLPATVFADGKVDTKKAKKNYNEGVKYEVEEKWDLATQAFLLAVAADPGNSEYRMHLLKACQNASQMFMKRGQAFEAEGDYASAYTAYKQAFAYDQTNEIAPIKMQRMIEVQKAQAGLGDAPKYNQNTGMIQPTSADIAPPQKYQPRSKDVAAQIYFKETSLKLVINSIAKQLGLNVIFDETFRDQSKYTLELQNTTNARALDFIFIQNKLTFEQLDRRTILIYLDNPNNRQRFERLMVKTFYVNNTKLEDARQVVQTMLQSGGGLNRQVAMSQQLNALIVRAPAEDLRMVQEVLESIDKNKAEVSIDVDIYEVSHSTSQQIGNQVATESQNVTVQTGVTNTGVPITRAGTTSSLANLGSFLGQNIISGVVGSALMPGTGFGALLAAPPTTLSLLQNKSNANLVSHISVHALDGQANKTNVGRKVPVNLGFAVPSTSLGTTTGTTVGGTASLSSFGYSSYQYQDVGLNIDITPTITNEGYIEMKMSIESSNTVPGTAGATQTPEFTQRKLTTISRVLDGRTSVVAGVQQNNKSDSRSTIPVVGLVPILGRLFTTPKEAKDLSDIVITVTPHIIRAPQIDQKDHKAKESGTGLGGNFVSIEQVVNRAQEEDDQDRRIIAAKQGLSQPPQSAETKTPDPVQVQTVAKPQTAITNVAAKPNNDAAVIKASNPAGQTAQAENPPAEKGAITNENAEEQGVPLPTFEPPPGYKPELKPIVLTEEQRKTYEESQAKARDEASKNPPKVDPSANGIPTPTFEPPPGYRPQLMPVRPPKKDEKPATPQSAQKDQKDISKVQKSETQIESRITPPDSADSPIGVSLKLGDKKPQLGESFIVVLTLDGKSKMTGANIALDYDTNLLQLKSVRDGGLLGKTPDMTQLDSNGRLIITMQQVGDKSIPVSTSGKLLILEFKAINSGQAQIALNTEETKFLLGNKINQSMNASPASFEIGRVAISKLNK